MSDCIFCKIANGELPSYKIYEDEKYLAFLDIFPQNTAQSIVIPKAHKPSKLNLNDKAEVLNLMDKALDVAKLIEDKIPEVERCQFVIEGLELNHLHIKLFPAFFPEPSEHAISKSGEKADDKELDRIAGILNPEFKNPNKLEIRSSK